MRRIRWLFPAAIVAILGAVGAVYLQQRALLDGAARPRPALLESGVQGRARDWCYEQAQGAHPRVSVCAAKMHRVGERTELEGVRLKLFHDNATEFDLVTSDFAQFHEQERKLYSDGDVVITLGVPAGGPTPGRLLKIHGSGVEFSSDTGEATTTRAVSFEFDRGRGSAVGAIYNPASRELRMESEVKLEWRGSAPGAPPMQIEAGQAFYLEAQSKVILTPWARLRRGPLRMEGGWTEILLENGAIRRADSQSGRGVHETPARKLEFGARDLHLFFDEHMAVNYILAEPEARLVSTSATTRTTVTGNRIDLNFAVVDRDSLLTGAAAAGSSTLKAEPVPRPGAAHPETRLLQSEVIRLAMRPGGEEIERVETDGPGTLEFLPTRPEHLRRSLTGDRIWIDYGPANRMERFRSVNATTRTELNPPRLTHSAELVAYLDAAGALSRLEQNTDFRYEEGDRRASARRAIFDPVKELLTLEGAASTSDATGRVTADRITLEQNSGDYTAEGNVFTARQPQRRAGGSSSLLSSEEILQATARRMTSTHNRQRIRYEGDAKAWQGANRVTADRIEIDQQGNRMQASGRVETQLVDKNAKSGPAPFTLVRAAELDYSTETRLAHYRGGVRLERPGLTVEARELRAFLNGSEAASALEKAFADGAVKIVSTTTTPGKGRRVRTSVSEHAEYSVEEQRVFLTGGQPTLVDSEKGRTTGCELTWWANNDRLQVVGGPHCPVQTVLPKK
jgi:lipopolysaccharide export system protein LptA